MCIGKTLGPLQHRTGYRYPVLYWKDGHRLLLHRYSWTRRDLYYVIACADAIHQRISISCPVLEAEPWQRANPFETLSAAPRRRWAHRFHNNNISCTRVPTSLSHLLMALDGQRCPGLLGRLAPGFLFFSVSSDSGIPSWYSSVPLACGLSFDGRLPLERLVGCIQSDRIAIRGRLPFQQQDGRRPSFRSESVARTQKTPPDRQPVQYGPHASRFRAAQSCCCYTPLGMDRPPSPMKFMACLSVSI